MKKFLENYFSLVKNLFPEKQPNKPFVGLDIGTYSCKLVELIPSKGSFEVLNFGVESIHNHDVASSVKSLLEKLDIEAKNLVTSVAGQGTLIRYIEMPKMGLNDARRSFALEADKYFPFVKDQIFTDCFIVDPDRPDNKMSLVAAAVKKEIIEQRIQLISSLGMDVNFIGINAVALANVFNNLGFLNKSSNDDETVAVLDIGHTITSLIILQRNMPRFTRDIFIGGGDFEKSIANILGVSREQATQLKRAPGEKSQEVLSACEAILNNLSSELRLSFDYFGTEHNIPITKLHLTGGSSLLSGIQDILMKNLDVAVEQWNPILSLKTLPGISQQDLQRQAPFLSVALGLALYQYD